jgi:hypothetical protein
MDPQTRLVLAYPVWGLGFKRHTEMTLQLEAIMHSIRRQTKVLGAGLLFIMIMIGASRSGFAQSLPGWPESALTLTLNSGKVFITNRSSVPRELGLQDGNPSLMLEYLDSRGKWVRAQAHYFSWCGNSYQSLRLEPGESRAFEPYLPTHGKRAILRYGLYEEEDIVVSKMFVGFVDPEEVARAAVDPVAILTGDLEFVLPIALGERKIPPQRFVHPRDLAVQRLIRLAKSDPEAAKSLRRIKLGSRDDPCLRYGH